MQGMWNGETKARASVRDVRRWDWLKTSNGIKKGKNVELKAQQIIDTEAATLKHIDSVQRFMSLCLTDMLERMEHHDRSKLESPEVEGFAEYTERLAASTYGSDEYKKMLEDMKPFLDHHYSKNRHHPEWHKNGINDMTLVDLIEVLCDWQSAVLRHNNGDIMKSIEINKERFGMSDQLVQIFKNTINFLI